MDDLATQAKLYKLQKETKICSNCGFEVTVHSDLKIKMPTNCRICKTKYTEVTDGS